jgi:hypothetical protein
MASHLMGMDLVYRQEMIESVESNPAVGFYLFRALFKITAKSTGFVEN